MLKNYLTVALRSLRRDRAYALLNVAGLTVGVACCLLIGLYMLDGFAYRIDLGPGVFLLAGGLALAIALLTVSTRAARAALADPVRALRTD